MTKLVNTKDLSSTALAKATGHSEKHLAKLVTFIVGFTGLVASVLAFVLPTAVAPPPLCGRNRGMGDRDLVREGARFSMATPDPRASA